MNLLTSRGNLKSKTNTNAVLLDKRTDKIVRYWRKSGFPYIETSKKFREEKFKSFLKTNDRSSFDFNNRIFKFNNAGLSLAWSYHPHAFKVRCNNFM